MLNSTCSIQTGADAADQTAAHHLSWVEGLHGASLHEEHVYEVNEDAWRVSGVLRRKGQPLVRNHEHKVAKQTQEEEQLREEDQKQVVSLLKVPGSNGKQQAVHTGTVMSISTLKWLLTCSCRCWESHRSSCEWYPLSPTSSSCRSSET